VGNFFATLKGRLPILERIPFIRNHPLFIPCAMASSFSFSSFFLIHQGLQEVGSFACFSRFPPADDSKTLPAEYQVNWRAFRKIKDHCALDSPIYRIPSSTTALFDQARDPSYSAVYSPEEDVENTVSSVGQEVTQRVARTVEGLLPIDKIQEISDLKELINRQLIIVLLNYAFISFLDQAQQTLLPMMYKAPIEEYGLGILPEDMIGIMATWGSCNTLVQLLLFPWLLQRFGSKKVYSTCLSLMILFFALFPMLHLIAAYFQNTNFVVRRLLEIHVGMSSLIYMAYGTSMECLAKHVTPHPSRLLSDVHNGRCPK